MSTDQRAILQLVAQGSIHSAQAERLLALTAGSRELAWALFFGLTTSLAAAHWVPFWPGLALRAQLLLHGLQLAAQPTFASLSHLFGGTL